VYSNIYRHYILNYIQYVSCYFTLSAAVNQNVNYDGTNIK
jgi:hypothetical protein